MLDRTRPPSPRLPQTLVSFTINHHVASSTTFKVLVGSRDVLLLRLHQLMVLKEWAIEGGGGGKKVRAWHILLTI